MAAAIERVTRIRALSFSIDRPLPRGRYRHGGFVPTLSLAVPSGWYAVQDAPGFFDVERDLGTPDVIAVQFARPSDLGAVDSDVEAAAATLRVRPGLTVTDPTPVEVGGRRGLEIVVDATDRDIAARRFIPVLAVPAGPISIASGRRLRVQLLATPEGLLAVLLGGSVRRWDAAVAASLPVVASIRFG